MIDIFNEKQMYDSVFTGQENPFLKIGIVLYQCFYEFQYLFLFSYACFMGIA